MERDPKNKHWSKLIPSAAEVRDLSDSCGSTEYLKCAKGGKTKEKFIFTRKSIIFSLSWDDSKYFVTILLPFIYTTWQMLRLVLHYLFLYSFGSPRQCTFFLPCAISIPLCICDRKTWIILGSNMAHQDSKLVIHYAIASRPMIPKDISLHEPRRLAILKRS